MTGKSQISRIPHRRFRILLLVQAFWVILVCLLGAWWAHLMLEQAERIAELERITGVLPHTIEASWLKTQRMLHWESAVFFVFLLTSVLLFFWLYWRDMHRARATQAFFASVTHELRTPLTSIRLQAESISDHVQSDFSKRLLEDVVRLETQVERTLELARVEGGGPLFMRTLNLRPLADRLAQTWMPSYAGRLTIHNHLPDVDIDADPTAVQLILKNLFENSIRHSDQDQVRATLELMSGGDHAEQLTIRYFDSGKKPASDPARLGKLFQKGPHSQGAGVGLYLVAALMRRMGGSAAFSGGEGFHVLLSFRKENARG